MIEDIQYLKNNSVKESYMFFVDSNERDRRVYPTPSEYCIQFENPFKQVYSLEVIDGSIPRTQYGVDNHNNILTLVRDETDYTIRVPIGDYTDINLIKVINDEFVKQNLNIQIGNTSQPADERTTFVFFSKDLFILDISRSTIGTVIGFDLYAAKNEKTKYEYVDSQIFASTTKSQVYVDVLERETDVALNDVLDFAIENITTASQKFLCTQGGMLKSVEFFDDVEFWSIHNQGEELAIGDLLLPGVMYEVRVHDATSTLKLSVVESKEEPIYVWKTSFNDEEDKRMYSSQRSISFTVTVSQLQHAIIAPGMYSLIGDRYVLLKCPEIESKLFESRAFDKYRLGLAKFKLAVMGYDESRFDFQSLPPREFHPIGKLQTLTFRFERPDGTLYNFRGINHTLTLIIRYLTPKQQIEFTTSTLNPAYNPDFFAYQQNQESDSDSET